MPLTATVMDSSTIDDEVTVEVIGDGQFMSFTLEQLQRQSPDPAHNVVTTFSDASDASDDYAAAMEGWRVAKAKAIEEGLILPDGE